MGFSPTAAFAGKNCGCFCRFFRWHCGILGYSYNCYISDGNCASKSTIYTDDLEVAARYDWETILSTGPIFENIRETVRMRNAELLIEGPVYISQHLKYIVFRSIADLELIRKMYPKYKDKMIVDTNLFKIW